VLAGVDEESLAPVAGQPQGCRQPTGASPDDHGVEDGVGCDGGRR
jgi:hypothetical protein